MRIRATAFSGLIVLWAAAAAAQPWKDALDRQDHATAAAVLQAAVFEHAPGAGARYPDVAAIQTLARLYAEGRGVAADPLTACALSNLGSGAAVYAYGEQDQRTVAIRRQVEAHCLPLTADERREAMQAASCLQPGPAPRPLLDTPARRIDLGRSQLSVTEGGRTYRHPLAPLLRCPQQVAHARHVRVPAPRGSRLGSREFVEVYTWHSTMRDGRVIRTLEWSAIELTRQTATLRARAVLERGEGSAWPARPVPAKFLQPVKFTMHKSGDVRWQMPGRVTLHGVIGRPAPLRARTLN